MSHYQRGQYYFTEDAAPERLQLKFHMPQMSLRRWTCLLLLLLYTALTVQLSIGSRNLLGRAKLRYRQITSEEKNFIGEDLFRNHFQEPDLPSGEQSKAELDSKTLIFLSANSDASLAFRSNSKSTVKSPGTTTTAKRQTSPIRSTEETPSSRDLADTKRFIEETPFGSDHIALLQIPKPLRSLMAASKQASRKLPTTKNPILKTRFIPGPKKRTALEKVGRSSSRKYMEEIEENLQKLQKLRLKLNSTEIAYATKPKQPQFFERIKQFSDPQVYSKMLDKLKSLGSAVTREQLRAAADKCGGDKPKLRHVQTYDFVHSPDHLCSAGELLALVAVHSNAKNLGRRATIRRTWGSLRYIGRFRIEVAFFLGRPASGDSDESGATGAQLEALIDAESSRFGDIVQLNYTENYRNMTIKHLGVYEWLLRRCRRAQFLVKVDDDTFVDVAHLATFLSKGAPSGLYCSATEGAKPQRTRTGSRAKWRVTKAEFSGRMYPTYCEGLGYILNVTHVANMYLCSMFKKFFWIDDVHVTGILGSSLGVPVTGFWKGHGYATLVPSLASEGIMDYLFLTAINSEFFEAHWMKLWHAVLRHSLDINL